MKLVDKEILESNLVFIPVDGKKIKITEGQYNRLFVNGDIILEEKELLEEQMDFLNNAITYVAGGIVDAAVDYGTDKAKELVKDAGNWFVKQGNEAIKGLTIFDYEKDLTKVLKDAVPTPEVGTYSLKDLKDAVVKNKEVPESLKMILDFVKNENILGELGEDVVKKLKILGAPIMDWKNNLQIIEAALNKALTIAANAGKLLIEWGNDFVEWLGTWDVQDWIDFAAIVCFCIPFPPIPQIVGVGLEVINAFISLAKGEKMDFAIRLTFVAGGALLSKTMSTTYKVASKQVAEKGRGIFVNLANKASVEGWEMGSKKTTDYLSRLVSQESKAVQKYTTELLQGLKTKGKKAGLEALQGVQYQMKEIMELTTEYMTKGWSKKVGGKLVKLSEEKAIYKATEKVLPKSFFTKWVKPYFPSGWVERSLLATVLGVSLSIKFKNFLKDKGMNDQQIANLEKKKEELVTNAVEAIGGIDDMTKELQQETIALKAKIAEKEMEKAVVKVIKEHPNIDVNGEKFDEYFIKNLEKEYTDTPIETNEEIIRIKELFSNKRLYGNLIN